MMQRGILDFTALTTIFATCYLLEKSKLNQEPPLFKWFNILGTDVNFLNILAAQKTI